MMKKQGQMYFLVSIIMNYILRYRYFNFYILFVWKIYNIKMFIYIVNFLLEIVIKDNFQGMGGLK